MVDFYHVLKVVSADYDGSLEMFLDRVRLLFDTHGIAVMPRDDWLDLYNLCFSLCIYGDNSKYEARVMDGIIDAFNPAVRRFQAMKQRQNDVMDYLTSIQIIRGPGKGPVLRRPLFFRG